MNTVYDNLTSDPSPTARAEMFDRLVGTIPVALISAMRTMTASDVWSTHVIYLLDYINFAVGKDQYEFAPGTSARDVARRGSGLWKTNGRGISVWARR